MTWLLHEPRRVLKQITLINGEKFLLHDDCNNNNNSGNNNNSFEEVFGSDLLRPVSPEDEECDEVFYANEALAGFSACREMIDLQVSSMQVCHH